VSDGVEQAIEARYQNSFGRRAGYLPKNRASVDRWLAGLKKELDSGKRKKRKLSPAVAELGRLIEHNGVVRMYVTQMIQEVPEAHRHIETIPELLAALDHISRTAPVYNRNPADQNNFFPMSNLFTYMMMTPAGEVAFRDAVINDALRAILKEWCQFLDSPESRYVLNEGDHGWLSQPAYEQYKLYEFEIPDRAAPHWGFASFNAFFHRQIKPEFRPVAAPRDPKVIVSANDGTVVTWERDVQPLANFWLKGQPYSLINMLSVSKESGKYAERFFGGDIFQSFLSGADYHRWHAPVEGVVRHTEKVEALMFSDAESAGADPTAATYSQGYEASVNTRGLVFIESPKVGMVCVIPIGITEISSVTITVKAGDKVKKGDELGYFSYGGSSLALAFEKGAIDRFTVPRNQDTSASWQDDGPPIYVNAEIAVAR